MLTAIGITAALIALYYLLKGLQSCRDYKDEKERENDYEYERHINLKK